MTKVDPNEMSFLDHLEDLRWHILRAIMGIVLAGSIAFIFKDYIFDNIIFGKFYHIQNTMQHIQLYWS